MMTFPQTLPLVNIFCSQLSPSIEVVSAAESGLGAHFGERGEREITWIFRVFSYLGSLQPRNGSVTTVGGIFPSPYCGRCWFNGRIGHSCHWHEWISARFAPRRADGCPLASPMAPEACW